MDLQPEEPNDSWRHKMNDEILREAMFYNGVSVEIRSAGDDNSKQAEDAVSYTHLDVYKRQDEGKANFEKDGDDAKYLFDNKFNIPADNEYRVTIYSDQSVCVTYILSLIHIST